MGVYLCFTIIALDIIYVSMEDHWLELPTFIVAMVVPIVIMGWCTVLVTKKDNREQEL